VQRQPALAATASLICFVTVAGGLWLALRGHLLNGLSAFLILALGWLTAGVLMRGRFSLDGAAQPFLNSEPGYWQEHWKYSRWVLATAPVFQLTTQGYYWLLAGLLSVREVAEFRAAYNFVAPVELAFASLVFLVLPALSTRYQQHSRSHFFVLLRRYVVVVLAVAVLFPLAARALGRLGMHVLYAGRFDDCVPLLYVLAFLPIFTAVSTGMASALNAAEKPKFVFFAYLASGATTFIAGIPLILRFGLRGAVYGMLLSGAVFSIALTIGFVLGIVKKSQPGALPRLAQAIAHGSSQPASTQEAR
jgi:O-antigen/teichoic acid export membrane protein